MPITGDRETEQSGLWSGIYPVSAVVSGTSDDYHGIALTILVSV